MTGLQRTPQLSIAGDVVTIRGAGVAVAAVLLKIGVETVERHYGRGPNAIESAILAHFTAAARTARAMSDERRPDVRPQAPGATSDMGGPRVGSRDAADLLGLSTRQVCRIARSLDGLKVGRTWTFNRDTLTAYKLTADEGRVTR